MAADGPEDMYLDGPDPGEPAWEWRTEYLLEMKD